ncbi:MAG: hypothetical protein HRU20_27390 [Pseudomonadales bacterium]|nr:hypothetical protein [Pseudomonadales bacterium]
MEKPHHDNSKKMNLWDMVRQAFSLLAQIQTMKNFSEATEQLEHNMLPLILAGIMAIFIFIGICFTAVFLVLNSAGVL